MRKLKQKVIKTLEYIASIKEVFIFVISAR